MKKLLICLGISLFSSVTHASIGAASWPHLTDDQKAELIDSYLEFYEEYNLTVEEPLSQLKPQFEFQIIPHAYASTSGMNCIYAGWPSKRINGVCSTPVRHNPGYESGSCKSNELQCQPMLFGGGFCVPTATSSQRSMAFSNCADKFAQSKRTFKDVVAEIESKGKQSELFEVMGFAEKTCSDSKQSGTGMCRRLLKVLKDLKKVDVKDSSSTSNKIPTPPKKEEKETPPAPPKPPVTPPTPPTPPKPPLTPPKKPLPPTKPEVIIDGKKEEDPKVSEDLINTIEQADKLTSQANSTGMILCDTSNPLDRANPRASSYSTIARNLDPNYETLYFTDKAGTEYSRGVRVRMTGPNSMAKMIGSNPTTRVWDFISDDNAVNGTYLHITDEPTPHTLSHLMESVIVLIPRKEKPRAETKGNEVHVTLPTGEMVIFDAKTKLIKKGAFKEEPIDTSPNRFQRKFANNYVGEGISLRVDRRGDDPRNGVGNVVITQKGKTCTLPKEKVWGGTPNEPTFKFNDDKKLVDFLNSSCSSKFSL